MSSPLRSSASPPRWLHIASTHVTSSSLWSLLLGRTAVGGGRTLLIGENGARVTFASAVTRAELIASALLNRGIGPGTRVAWQLPNTVETVLVMLALARLGAVQVPIGMTCDEREIRAAITSSNAEAVLVPRIWRGVDCVARVAAAPRVIAIGPEMFDGASAEALPEYDNDDRKPRWIFFTPGTTGTPKGVRHTDAALLAAANGLAVDDRLGVAGRDIGSVMFPITSVAGVVYLTAMMKIGLPAVLLDYRSPAYVIGVLRQFEVTVACANTGVCDALIDMQRALPRKSVLLPDLRLLKGMGEPCSSRTFHAAEQALGVVFARDYGMTEAPLIAASGPADPQGRLAATDGRRTVGTWVRVVERGVEVRAGLPGEIEVSGACVCHGYVDPQRDNAAFTADRWFRTGDWGRLDADGHLKVFGRSDIHVPKRRDVAVIEGITA